MENEFGDGSSGGSEIKKQVSGAEVLQEVVQMTGLPKEYLDSEISSFLGTGGESVKNLTLDQLRSVLMNYLETINEEMTQEQNKH